MSLQDAYSTLHFLRESNRSMATGMAGHASIKVILGSLVANIAIAVSKAVAAVMTGSGSLLAESIHSAGDSVNQVLLLIGARHASQEPDPGHPLGYGRAAYFWSFIVALMIFFGGGVFSIYEGLHKVFHPEPISKPLAGFVVLVIALVIEFAAAVQAAHAINEKRGETRFFRFLRVTTDVDLVVLFAENAAAVVGLLLALAALGLAVATNDGRWDGAGSVAIGGLLMVVAVFLAREVKSLLIGERANPAIEIAFREEVAADPQLGEVLRLITVQQGPGQVVLAAKLKVKSGVMSESLTESFNRLEDRMRTRCPEVKWQFLEPDTHA